MLKHNNTIRINIVYSELLFKAEDNNVSLMNNTIYNGRILIFLCMRRRFSGTDIRNQLNLILRSIELNKNE